MRRAHSVTDGTPDSVEVDLEAMPGRVARSLERQLAEGERIVIRTRQHPAVLVRKALWPVAALVVYLWFDTGLHVAEQVLRLTGIVLLVGLVRLGWAELQRRYRWIVVTNKRILKHEGVLDVSVPMMRLTKVTDMTYRRTLLGELLGFGTIIIESAGQQQAIRELTFIPEPDHVNAALNSEIFGEKPRERRSGGGRSWPKLPRRPRRRDDDPDDGDDGGGPPRGRGPGPEGSGPTSPGGGVEVSPAGHPPMPVSQPETWYRSSNLVPPRMLGDTGEIPVARAEAVRDDDVRAIPLYPPRDWVDEQR
ncbi:PH domain-containing protein [Phycicoccus avicenniae]|uniref:PH domain-containing protein n=1 Tax=Phycicoccus avicenniae TaxID=2828860 RepID=UPI003D2B25AD